MPPKRLALLGAVMMAVAQSASAFRGASDNIPLFWLSMLMQGAGMGLFQVAYFDIATATIPRRIAASPAAWSWSPAPSASSPPRPR